MLPEEFKSILPDSKMDEVFQWWGALSKENQDMLSGFYSKGESLVINSVDAINAEIMQRNEVAFEADIIRDTNTIDFPNQEYYENLIGNEVYLCARGPIFHVCKAHKTLRLYLLLGILPANFSCFIGNNQCQMKRNLKTSHSGYWQIKLAKLKV